MNYLAVQSPIRRHDPERNSHEEWNRSSSGILPWWLKSKQNQILRSTLTCVLAGEVSDLAGALGWQSNPWRTAAGTKTGHQHRRELGAGISAGTGENASRNPKPRLGGGRTQRKMNHKTWDRRKLGPSPGQLRLGALLCGREYSVAVAEIRSPREPSVR
jgi:hypothetical protein